MKATSMLTIDWRDHPCTNCSCESLHYAVDIFHLPTFTNF